MCGIAGEFHLDRTFVHEKAVKSMVNALSHRGPDDEGLYVNKFVGLGHRRLSIIDLTTHAHQPMTYESSGSWLVFNGEIYNYLELKSELSKLGYRFKTESDTEVLLVSYIEWGVEAFNRFNGMWAFALYDANTHELILCRDRYGIKPLYYYHHNHCLAFASEYKALLANKSLRIERDQKGLITALDNPFYLESSGHTLFKHVRSLQPGYFIKVKDMNINQVQWWKTVDHLYDVPEGMDEQAREFKELFFDACKLRMRADVKVATSLSGGLDSSSIVSSLQHLGYTKNKAFIHGFEGTIIDETSQATQLARKKAIPYRVIEAASEGLIGELDDIIYAFESIYPGMPDSAYRVYQAQKEEGYKVSLDGHGVDEMMAGYPWHIDAAMKDAPIYPFRKLATLMEMKSSMGIPAGKMGLSTILKTLGKSSKPYAMLKEVYMKYGGGNIDTRFLSGDILTQTYSPILPELPDGWSHLKKRLYLDFHSTVLPRILRNFDLMSMANSVEVRMPFMDYRLVNYVFSLPDQAMIADGFTKALLREAVKGIVPNHIRLQKIKIGFNSPMVDWFKCQMRPWIEEILQNPAYDLDVIDKRALKAYYDTKILTGCFDWGGALNFWKYLNALKLFYMLEARNLPC